MYKNLRGVTRELPSSAVVIFILPCCLIELLSSTVISFILTISESEPPCFQTLPCAAGFAGRSLEHTRTGTAMI